MPLDRRKVEKCNGPYGLPAVAEWLIAKLKSSAELTAT
jgi:hypothetical protein